MGQSILILLIANFIGGGLTPLFVKLGVREISPITFTFFRFLLATIFILPFFLKEKRSHLSIKKAKPLIWLNSLFFAGNMVIFSFAIQYTTVLMSQFFYSFVPILVGVFSFFFLGERISKNRLIGSVIAFSGLVLLIEQSLTKSETLSLGTPLGNFLLCLSVTCWSFYFVMSKEIHEHHSLITMNFTNFIFTVFVLSPFAISEMFHSFNITAITGLGAVSLVGVAIFSAVYINLLQRGIKSAGTFISSLFSYTGPFFAALIAVPVLGEKLTWSLLFGGVLILFGVFYATSYTNLKKWITNRSY